MQEKNIITKICTYCNKNLPLSNFNKCSRVKDGRKAQCRECSLFEHREYNKRNKDIIKNKNINYYHNNREERNKKGLVYYHSHRKERIAYGRKYLEEHRQQKHEYNVRYAKIANQRMKLRRQTDVVYRLTIYARNKIYKSLKRAKCLTNKTERTLDILGCTPSFLWKHLESKFQPGMTKENYGQWHVDHIIPIASFDLKDPKQLKKCFHYTNLQPLWWQDNLEKGNKLDWVPKPTLQLL
jgi:hypothetical protein